MKNPIELTSETVVVVNGKKCVLRVDPESNNLVAYPVRTEGTRVFLVQSFHCAVVKKTQTDCSFLCLPAMIGLQRIDFELPISLSIF